MARPLCDIYPPEFPRERYTSPADKYDMERWKEEGLIDSDGNLTEYGRKKGLSEIRIRGTETEEHYQQYQKDYAEYLEKYFYWVENDGNPDNMPDLIRRPQTP